MNYPTAEIITIGDEILYGQILDTNSQWMCQELDILGIKVGHRVTIGDDHNHIIKAFTEAWSRADIVLVTGGLGPTDDDLTKPCLAEFFDTQLEIDHDALAEVTEFFNSRGKDITEVNRQQAAVPVGAEYLSNKMGTAPGLLFHKEGKIMVAMAGVPAEMKYLMKEWVLPRIQKEFQLPVIYHKVIKTVGIGESILAEKVRPWTESLPENVSIAYLPSLGIVKVRITSDGDDESVLADKTEEYIEQFKTYAGKYVFGYNDDTLEGKIGDMLKAKGMTIGAAESCTGGYLSHMITRIPGSSEYFMGTMISYDYAVKENQLNVPHDLMEEHGAVSEEVVTIMAREVRKMMNTDIGVSISGIAGPGGGTDEKPVGTVWICYDDGEKSIRKKLTLGYRTRTSNIHLSALAVLNLIRLQLQDDIRENGTKS